jgi:hypothetical protein
MEVKDGEAPLNKQRLNDAEKVWHANWRGSVQVVHSVEEAVSALRACETREPKEARAVAGS